MGLKRKSPLRSGRLTINYPIILSSGPHQGPLFFYSIFFLRKKVARDGYTFAIAKQKKTIQYEYNYFRDEYSEYGTETEA